MQDKESLLVLRRIVQLVDASRNGQASETEGTTDLLESLGENGAKGGLESPCTAANDCPSSTLV